MPFYVVVVSSTGNTRDGGGDSSGMRGALLPWWRRKMNDVLSVLKIGPKKSREFFCFWTEASAILQALWDVEI